MQEHVFDIIAAGHICLDMFPRFTHDMPLKISDIFRPGTLVKMGEMAFSTGGSVSNTGIAMKIFGAKVGFIAKVGKDAIGSTILEILKHNGNAEGVSVSPAEGSSYTVVIAPPGIDRIFLHCPGTNDTFVASDIDFDLVGKAKLFHFGYPTLMKAMYADNGAELEKIFRQAKEHGATTSLDISLPDPNSEAGKADWNAIYRRVLPFVDIYLPSIEEAFFTLHPEQYLSRKSRFHGEELIDHLSADEYSELAGEFLDLGCKVIALKCGHNGWLVKTAAQQKAFSSFGRLGNAADFSALADKELWCPAFQVERIASATGSGDTSIAAFLVGLARGFDLEQCLKFANCAGCMNLSALDALSGLGSWDVMERRIGSLRLREMPLLANTSWRFDEQRALWRKTASTSE